jgi:hypothetical protein
LPEPRDASPRRLKVPRAGFRAARAAERRG